MSHFAAERLEERPAAGSTPGMDLGDIVVYGNQQYYVRGVDPVGARPRFVYLENLSTGKQRAVAFEQLGRPGGLRLIRDDDPRPSGN